MRSDQILAFRFSRSGLDARDRTDLASAVDCPTSDRDRDAALIAIAARADGIKRAAFERAIDRGSLVMAHAIRGSLHVVAPEDHTLFGASLIADHDDDLARQLGPQLAHLCEDEKIHPTDALAEVTEAVRKALASERQLSRDELHEQMRHHVRDELLPWCERCRSHHVPPLLWRFATAMAGVRLDSQRRYRVAQPADPPPAHEAAHRFLRWYGPATPGEFSEWAGVAPSHGRRLWEQIEDELVEIEDPDGRAVWLLGEDMEEFNDPPPAEGVRLLPPGDPYLWKPNRKLLARDESVRNKLFRPAGSPGAMIVDGKLVGSWRARAKRQEIDFDIEPFTRLKKGAVEEEALRLASLRGVEEVHVTVH
ncbi:MAG: AlkZ family DNA glycosylase [Solirubrobacteraceae bacterium]|nr:AlkZ family DNA glycosylase [Solirubrobacteraceae bacterium]